MGNEYFYLSVIPRDVNSNFELLLASSYCPLLNGSDIRCINAEDCEVLKRYQIDCPLFPTPKGQIGVLDENNEEDEKMFLAWLIPVIIIAIIVVAIIYVVARKMQHHKVNLIVCSNNLVYPY